VGQVIESTPTAGEKTMIPGKISIVISAGPTGKPRPEPNAAARSDRQP
jgi:beta-lactam-binding protein with PASTA domain